MRAHPTTTVAPQPTPSLGRMATLSRRATVTVLAIELVLLVTGRVSLGTAVAVLLAVEVAVGAVILVVAWRAARTHPGNRLAAAVRAVLPRPVAALALVEVRQLRSLWLLVRGRVDTEGRRDRPIPYAAGRGGIYLMIGAACGIELVVVHVAVPWERLGGWSWLQWLALALSAYGVLWLLSWWAAQRTHPHLLTPEEVVLRNGTVVSLRIPLGHVAAVTPRRRGLEVPDRLMLGGPGGATNLDIELRTPVTWRSPTGRRTRQVTAVSIEVDDAALASEWLAEAIAR